MAVSAHAPTIEELAGRAGELAPKIRERVAETQALRHVPETTISELRDAGLFRVFEPARYGGYELDYGPTQIALANALGPADGSVAWVHSVVACHAWLLGMYPLTAQDAVWGDNPDTLIASAFSARTGAAKPVDGGYWLQGDWEFSSGVHACDWIILAAPVATQPGPPLFCLVPRAEFEILDTWRSPGLRGTGSHEVRVAGAFVPADLALNTGQAEGQRSPGAAINATYIYNLPLFSVFPYNICAPSIGIARGAVDAWVAAVAPRADRANMPTRQMRLGESCAEVDAAEALLLANAAELKRLGTAGTPVPPQFRAKCGRDLAYAAQLCMRAVDRLMGMVGAHGMSDDSEIARARADVYAAGNHAGLQWDRLAAGFGASLLGVQPARP